MQATAQFDVRTTQCSWASLDLRTIPNDTAYEKMVTLMNVLLDVLGDDEDHVLAGLLELVGNVVSKYELEHHAIELLPRAPD